MTQRLLLDIGTQVAESGFPPESAAARLEATGKGISDADVIVQALLERLPPPKPWQRQLRSHLRDADRHVEILRLEIPLEHDSSEIHAATLKSKHVLEIANFHIAGGHAEDWIRNALTVAYRNASLVNKLLAPWLFKLAICRPVNATTPLTADLQPTRPDSVRGGAEVLLRLTELTALSGKHSRTLVADIQYLNLLTPITMEEQTVSALASSGICRTYLCSPVYACGFEHFDLDDDGGLTDGVATLAKAIVPAKRIEELLEHLQFELALTGVRFWISPVIRQGKLA